MRRKLGIFELALVSTLILLPASMWVGTASAQPLFATPVHYPVGLQPQDVASGDLNQDDYVDLVVVNEASSNASVLLNNGNGTFQPAVPYLVGNAPLAVTIAKINNDQHPDAVVTNSGSASVSVLINNGDGTFAPAVNYPVGAEPWGVLAKDLNGDNYIDVAVVNRGSGTFSVLLNDGDGTLSLSGSYSASGAYINPTWLTGADFDDDQDVDIAVVKNYRNLYFTQGYVQIFANDGNGNYPSSRVITLGLRTTTPMAADLDGDEDIDLAVSGFVGSSNKLSVLLNDGAGNFADPVAHSSAGSGRAICADLDCDNDFDVAISRENYGDASFAVILNNGDATFAGAFTVYVGPDARGLTAGDFDRDCDLDIAVAIMGDNSVAVTMNTTDPTTGVGDYGTPAVVAGYRLHPNYPNPFNPTTTLAYSLPSAARVELSIYDLAGRLVKILVGGEEQGAGSHSVVWRGKDDAGRAMPSGTYFYRLEAGGYTETRRMTLVR
jgi:hypothetical protein